jgi:hypothetical protein
VVFVDDLDHAGLPDRQREDLWQRVRPHLLAKLPESAPAARLQADVEELVRRLEPERDGPLPAGGADDDQAQLEAWHHAADELLGHVQSRLREIRQLVTVGPRS